MLNIFMISQISFVSVAELARLAEAELDNYWRSNDVQIREISLHKAFADLYRWIEPGKFVPEVEKSRLKFSSILGLPKHPEDRRFCDEYLAYFE